MTIADMRVVFQTGEQEGLCVEGPASAGPAQCVLLCAAAGHWRPTEASRTVP